VTSITRTIASPDMPVLGSGGETQSIPDELSGSNRGATPVRLANQRFRILAVMAQGSPGVLPEAWQSYVNPDEARIGPWTALRDARVLEVAIVEDHHKPLRLVDGSTSHPTADDLVVQLSRFELR
jgi:hypothetical protein